MPTIAVDIDDVLSASAEGFAAYSKKHWGSKAKAQDYTEAWAVFWDVPIDEVVRRGEQFHASDAVAGYKHFPDALPVLHALHNRYKLVIVTSRRRVLQAHTDMWLNAYFPGLFSETHYVGMWDTDKDLGHKLKQTKTETCRQIGADYLIDDQPKHCHDAAGAGIQSILFGDYAWNRAPQKLSSGVIRAKNWYGVKEYFDAQG
ncbi:MAG TPA: hypothetical protein VMY99_00110 [Nevskiaceae bacterium]|nr:hypothetical protein [Nevskiaceae bacterium]